MYAARALIAGLVLSLVNAVSAKGPAYTDPAKTDADFPFQGEYTGTLKTADGDQKVGLQIIALGGGKFHGVGYRGGLPGDGWDGSDKHEGDGELTGGVVILSGGDATAKIKDSTATVTSGDGEELGQLKKIERKSPTFGATPPEGAVVLFDGKSAEAFTNGKLTEDGLLQQGCTSKQKFGSCKVHIEFRLPYQPEDRGQARGNSGIYVGARYECQMLDSFGLKGENNECGGLYSVKAPDVNMCLPPLSWQTYDIDYTAAVYEGDKLVKHPRVTIAHNGVVIHKDVELPGERSTTAAPNKPGPEPGPIYLQDHGNPVRYRNIWVVETKEVGQVFNLPCIAPEAGVGSLCRQAIIHMENSLATKTPDPFPPAPPRRGQFSVGDLLILTVGVAVGSWMPTDVFAAALGLLTLLGLLVVSWRPPHSHLGKLLWATVVVAYVVAVFAAVLRPL